MRLSFLLCAAAFGIATMASANNNPPSVSKPDQKVNMRQSQNWQRPVDCHRNVQTHRINGVKITHRHVGDNCQIRQVKKVN